MLINQEVIIFRLGLIQTIQQLIHMAINEVDLEDMRKLFDEMIIDKIIERIKHYQLFSLSDIEEMLDLGDNSQILDVPWDQAKVIEELLDFVDVLVNNRDEFVYDDDIFRVIDLYAYIGDNDDIKEMVKKWRKI